MFEHYQIDSNKYLFGAALALCTNMQKFKQIYFHNLNFCEVAFLTHSFTTGFFFLYDFVVFGFEEQNIYQTCKFLYIYKQWALPAV